MSLIETRVTNKRNSARKMVETSHKTVGAIVVPVIVSIVMMNAFPPSKNGRGSMFNSPIFKLSTPRTNQKRRGFIVRLLPMRLIMPMGPIMRFSS